MSVLLSVCPSVLMEKLGSHETDFHDIWNFSIFRKSVDEIRIPLNYHKNNGDFT